MNIKQKVEAIVASGNYSLREAAAQIGCSHELVRLILSGERGNNEDRCSFSVVNGINSAYRKAVRKERLNKK